MLETFNEGWFVIFCSSQLVCLEWLLMAEISPWMKATSLMVIINATSDEKWLTHLVLEMEYSGRISHYQGSRCHGSVHHQAWCRLCWTMSSMRKDFSYLCQHNVVKWWETQSYFMLPQKDLAQESNPLSLFHVQQTYIYYPRFMWFCCVYCHPVFDWLIISVHFRIDVLSIKLLALIQLSLRFMCIHLLSHPGNRGTYCFGLLPPLPPPPPFCQHFSTFPGNPWS